jgi:hypothetical protein
MKALLCALALAIPFSAAAKKYSCTPEVKHRCTHEACTTITEGFQHAESFSYDRSRSMLSACLWSSCYEGRAWQFKEGQTFTAIGKLSSQAQGPASQLVVSLTVSPDKRFVAVWSYAGDGITADMGHCEVEGG